MIETLTPSAGRQLVLSLELLACLSHTLCTWAAEKINVHVPALCIKLQTCCIQSHMPLATLHRSMVYCPGGNGELECDVSDIGKCYLAVFLALEIAEDLPERQPLCLL